MLEIRLEVLLSGLAGFLIVAVILWDAFETVLVPRRISRKIRLTRQFYQYSWRIWHRASRQINKSSRRESFLGFYGPLSLLLLLGVWATGLIFGFSLLQLCANRLSPGAIARSWGTLLYMSGETFFTLGYGDITPTSALGRTFSVMEAGVGFGFLGTVIGYLPTLYGTFSQREIEVTLLDARAGSPPTATEFLARMSSCHERGLPDELLRDWERWSAQVLETHISYPLLAYYRSQHGNQSWLGALTMILDSSAIILAGLDGVEAGQARLTFAMARHAMVDITQIFVSQYQSGRPDRLPPEALALMRERLAGSAIKIPATPEFEARLAAIRRRYEPYAQALAEHLLLELPPWIHAEQRKDNWRGGPWDKTLGTGQGIVFRADEHF